MSAHLSTPAWGTGLSTVTADGTTLDVWYPSGHLGLGARRSDEPKLPALAGPASLDGMSVVEVSTEIASLANAPADAADVYLRLHLLSHRLIQPHQANLDGIFALLANVAWTSAGPCPPDRVDDLRYL
ncbi:MAG TPA: 2,3,4,5-tetrahydropyridine-2,6-dicarboxylate N-succinyltransferase, partial [Micromonosporaceae bacterium]